MNNWTYTSGTFDTPSADELLRIHREVMEATKDIVFAVLVASDVLKSLKKAIPTGEIKDVFYAIEIIEEPLVPPGREKSLNRVELAEYRKDRCAFMAKLFGLDACNSSGLPIFPEVFGVRWLQLLSRRRKDHAILDVAEAVRSPILHPAMRFIECISLACVPLR